MITDRSMDFSVMNASACKRDGTPQHCYQSTNKGSSKASGPPRNGSHRGVTRRDLSPVVTWILATWNVRGVKGKEEVLIDIMKVKGIDILCVTETKRKGCESLSMQNDCLGLWCGVNDEEHGSEGVGLILSREAKGYMRQYELVSPRLLWVRMKIGVLRVMLIGGYAPVDGEEDAKKDQFWESVRKVIEGCDEGERVILMGDLNGWVGIKRVGAERAVGPWGDPRVNDNGRRVVDLCLEHGLFISNTWFRHKSIHQYTWQRGDQKSMIDMVVYDERLRGHVRDTRVYRGAECDTDHYLVVSRVDLGRKWMHKKPSARIERVKSEKLMNLELRSDYAKMVTGRLSGKRIEWEKKMGEGDVEWGYGVLSDTLKECAKEVCGMAKGGKKRESALWWNQSVEEVVKEKKRVYLSMIAATGSERKRLYEVYKEQKRRVKVAVKESKAKVKEDFEKKMESDFESNKKLFWKWVKNTRSVKNENACGVRAGNGDLIWNDEEGRERWREYFEGLYGGNADEENDCNSEIVAVTEECELISMKELLRLMRGLPNGKAPGEDGVTNEMLKWGGATLAVYVMNLFNACLRYGRVPVLWVNALLVPLFKGKGDKFECKNYRAISLLSVTGKLYARCLVDRVKMKTEEKIWDVQGGFMSGRGCTDQIFSLQQLIEKHVSVNKSLYCAFIDLEKAFDTVCRSLLWKVLEEYGVQGKLLQAVKSMYVDSKARARVNGGLSECFQVMMGVRQGCVMSPWLFNIFIDKCMRVVCQGMKGVTIGDKNVSVLLYADDAVLLAENADELQRMLDSLNEGTTSMNLRVNVGKTKVVVFESEKEARVESFHMNGQAVEVVQEFVYLGRLFEKNGSVDGEIERRASAGRRVAGSTMGLARSQFLSKKAKLAIRNSILLPTLLYGSESWVLQARHTSRINAVDMSYMRGICGKSRWDHVKNVDIMNECGINESVNQMHERSVLRWFGHVERMDDGRLTKQIYKGSVNGRRGKGRPRKTWLDVVDASLKNKRVKSTKNKRKCQKQLMGVNEAREVCKDRKMWVKIVYGQN
jgi:hypothetical protein